MKRSVLVLACLAALGSVGCSTVSSVVDAVNPFSGGGKLPALPALSPSMEFRGLWESSVGKSGVYQFVPAVVGTKVFVAAADGMLTRIEDGKVIWKENVAPNLSAGVGADERLVVVATGKGEVIAVSSETGKPVWKALVSSEVLAPPALAPEGVVVRSGDNRVVLLDRATGQRKWVYQRATPPLSLRSAPQPLIQDGYVFVGYPGGKLVALTLTQGAPVWEGTVASPKGATELDRVADVAVPPVIEGRQICAVAFQGRIACFDLGQNGAQIWARDFSSASGLVLDGRYLFVTDERGVVHAMDRLTGSSLWKQDKLAKRELTGPVILRGQVMVADGAGYVHALSRDEGAFVGRTQTDGSPIRTTPKVMGSTLVIQTSGGRLLALEPR